MKISPARKINLFYILVLLISCTPTVTPVSNDAISTITRAVNTIPSETVTFTIPAQSVTLEPLSQETQAVLQPIWTSQPTLTSDEAIDAVNNMVATNGGCQLPCWWGITPGETSWENALTLLSRYSPDLKSSESSAFSWDGSTYFNSYTNYVFFETPNSEIRQGGIIVVFDGVVSRIIVGEESTGSIFDIPNLLAVYGEPANIIIDTFNNTPTGILPFHVVMFYPDYHFVAVFEFTGNKIGEVIKMCYKPSTPTIYLWSPVEDVYIDVSGFSGLVPGDWAFSKDLEISTNSNIKMFYQNFINPTNASCLETPSDLW